MRSYIEQELPALIAAELTNGMKRQSNTGQAMGGHGALFIALRAFVSIKDVRPPKESLPNVLRHVTDPHGNLLQRSSRDPSLQQDHAGRLDSD
jgi:hypothetical protein